MLHKLTLLIVLVGFTQPPLSIAQDGGELTSPAGEQTDAPSRPPGLPPGVPPRPTSPPGDSMPATPIPGDGVLPVDPGPALVPGNSSPFFPGESLGNSNPVIGATASKDADSLRREAVSEAQSAAPSTVPAQHSFGQNDTFRLRQQIDGLSNYLRTKESQLPQDWNLAPLPIQP